MHRTLGIVGWVCAALLLLVCIQLSWLLTWSHIERAFLQDYVKVFYEMKQLSKDGELAPEEAARYVEFYYPVDSKLKSGEMMSNIVETIRSDVLTDINALRKVGVEGEDER